jgi:hypothetical protein
MSIVKFIWQATLGTLGAFALWCAVIALATAFLAIACNFSWSI